MAFRPPPWRDRSAFARGLGVCLASACLLGCPQVYGEAPEVVPATTLVVGLDGADWDVLMPLIEAGHLPTIGGLIESGARADFDCVPAWPSFACYCPPVWVSIATGQPLSVHGISQLNQSSAERTAPAIWELQNAVGETSVMSSWRNTRPPEDGRYFVFTESGNSLAGQVNYAVWGTAGPPPAPLPSARPSDLYAQLGLLPFTTERLASVGVMAKDRTAAEGFIRLAESWPLMAPGEPRPRLNMIILHSIDKAEHATWNSIQPEPGDPIDSDRVVSLADAWNGPVFGPAPFALGNPVSQYMEAEMWLTELLDVVSYDYVVFVSDHGMERSLSATGLAGKHGPNLPAAHVGIFAISGPGIPGDVVLDPVSVLDVAPTLAYLLDLPVAEDLPGSLLLDAFDPGWVDEHPPTFVDTW